MGTVGRFRVFAAFGRVETTMRNQKKGLVKRRAGRKGRITIPCTINGIPYGPWIHNNAHS